MTRKVRKQIYLDPQQEAALKRQAAETGASEAEIIRQAIDNQTRILRHPVAAWEAWQREQEFIRSLMGKARLPVDGPGAVRIFMTGRILVDTNVLVYAYDRSEPAKQAQALQVLTDLSASRAGVISVQVLIEFYNAVTRRIVVPLTAEQAYERIKNLVMAWQVLEITPLIALEAARGASQHQMRIWDAQIWATARLNQIPIIFSEDFSDGAVTEGIRFVNPFAPSFRGEDWI